MIQELELKNFTVFKDLKIAFSPKINVIIGENGTGKTHLLKAAYGICAGNKAPMGSMPHIPADGIEGALTEKLCRLFLPLDNKLGNVHRKGSRENARLNASFIFDKSIAVEFNQRSHSVSLKDSNAYERYSWIPVFIPTKEVLSILPAFVAHGDESELLTSLFDDTYRDLCRALIVPTFPSIAERIDSEPRFSSVYLSITEKIGGKYEIADGNYYFRRGKYIERRSAGQHKLGGRTETIFKAEKGGKFSNSMTAEGFKKLGILQQLLVNRSLVHSASGPLFWDEPESNLNPSLVRFLVESLLDFSRNGQQIILATHDYVVLKWLDLLMDKGKEDHVRYHSLSSDETGNVVVESTDHYKDLDENAIASTFTALYDAEIERSFAGRGEKRDKTH